MHTADRADESGQAPVMTDAMVTRRVALVTGGARGVGATVVRALSARGFAVAIHCHGALAEARTLAAEHGDRGHPALAVTANLRDEGPVRAMVHRVADHFGRIDVLVSGAMIRRRVMLEEIVADDLRSHFDVNCVGAFICAQECGAVMCGQSTGGVIVLLGDHAAIRPRSGELAAAAAAGAIPALAGALSGEFNRRHPRVRVHAVLVESGAGEQGVVEAGVAVPAASVADEVLRLVA